ncbi:transcription termination factor 1 [Python bivittatus]|uniref:Transcription termination factor 1 n=1 Tax=Python bivittatus TaxID=176946 RepID=A0A9F2KUY1_PYTBI|nr:transcription termination factor 1 [Python bivittatus]XP_025020533.1 transcription termination factor 1 [Python bivittatus]
MDGADVSLAEDALQSGFAKKKKKSRKRDREKFQQPTEPPESPDQPPLSCQDAEDSEVGRKKSKKKKARRETSESQVDYSWVTAEPELNCETEISNSGHKKKKKKKKKKKHKLNKHGSDDELWSQPAPKSPNKLCQKEDLENGGGVHDHVPSHKKKKRKRMEEVCVPDEPVKEQTEATSSNREDPMEVSDSIDTQMDLFASSPLSLAEIPQDDLLQEEGDAQEGNCSPAADDSDVTEVDLVMEGTSAGDHEQTPPGSPPPKLPTSKVKTRLNQSVTSASAGTKHPPSSEHPPSEIGSLDEDESLELSDMEQLEAVTKELEEFIPHVRTLSELAIKQLAKRDLARFRDFKKKGVAVKFGTFSKAENDLLKENVEAFLEESGIETAEKLLFSHRFPEEQAEIKRRKCQYLFCEGIARGIPRPWRLVYYRARKMFDPQNYNGRYSKKEKKQLHKYHAMYGNNWKKISEHMNRSSHSIALKYTQMIEDSNLGPWSKEETRRLIQTLKDILRTKVKGLDSALEKGDADEALILLRENLYKDIGWMKVAAKVETRGWRQCKKKWTSIVTKKMMGKERFHGLNNLQFKIDLIERLYEQNVADTNEIDWELIANAIGNAPPDYVQQRYYRLKTAYVPFWNEKNFPEIIDYLFEETLPMLKESMERLSKRRTTRNKDRSWKKSFQFNDIFQDELEDDELISEDDSDEEMGEPSHVDG